MQRREDDIPSDGLLTRITVSLGPKPTPEQLRATESAKLRGGEMTQVRFLSSAPGFEVVNVRLGRDRT